MTNDEQKTLPLTPGAQRLVELAVQNQKDSHSQLLGVNHWLLALVERHGAMAEVISNGLNSASLRQELVKQLGRGNMGSPLEQQSILKKSSEHAANRGMSRIVERDLAAVILIAGGYGLVEEMSSSSSYADADPSTKLPKDLGKWSPDIRLFTQTLERYLTDLTSQAREGKLNPIVGRDDEIQLVIETLCRRTKRNPVLIGPAGVGKTAIIEGLAHRVVLGEVPKDLRNVRIFSLQPSVLVAGAQMAGELEKRVKDLLQEACQDSIILFIDEVHTIIGAGGIPGRSDIASILKPSLARGDIACIAATTDDEYRRYIEPDTALERRFQPVRIHELNADHTLVVLKTLRDEFYKLRNVRISDSVLVLMMDYARRYLRNRYFPDKAVDLLEQCVAFAVAQGKDEVDQDEAEIVLQRMVGMPLSIENNLQNLRAALTDRVLLPEEDTAALVNRLEVTLRGLDMRPARPNAVILLLNDATTNSEELAKTISTSLYGSERRVVTIDFSPLIHANDVTRLIGAPPGYVGYEDTLLLHQVSQMPWCVLLCKNIEACHAKVLSVMTQGLSDGFITTGKGRHIYLSDLVVILTANVSLKTGSMLGFNLMQETTETDSYQHIAAMLGNELLAQVDLISAWNSEDETGRSRRLTESVLANLSGRFRELGMNMEWDKSFIDWLTTKQSSCSNERDWERLVDESLNPALIPLLKDSDEESQKLLLVKYLDGNVRVEKIQS
jgi:ATP-dependent Clp protease ATP-binding subunit ClpC